jgi:polyferredoxin
MSGIILIRKKGTGIITVTSNIRRFIMVKSIVWIVVVVLLMVFLGGRIFPGILNMPIPLIPRVVWFGFTLIPYVWLLVLAIMSLVRSIRKSGTET